MFELRLEQSIAGFLADQKAKDIVILEVSDLTSVTDYFVIATGRSGVHVKAACRRVEEGTRELGRRPISSEGIDNGHWALLDYGEVVVHVFQQDSRSLYDLERLWSRAPRKAFEDLTAVAVTRN